MKKLAYGLAAVALAIGFSAFTTPSVKKDAQYWVYTSPTNEEFQYAIKYEIQTLASPSAANCQTGISRPCVLAEVTDNLSDTTELHNYLQNQGSDGAIVGSSLTKQPKE